MFGCGSYRVIPSFPYPTRQPLTIKTTSKPRAPSSILSSAADDGITSTSVDQSDDTVPGRLEADDLAAARAQLKARAGAKGRRGSKPGRGAGGHGQVRIGSCSRINDKIGQRRRIYVAQSRRQDFWRVMCDKLPMAVNWVRDCCCKEVNMPLRTCS